MSKDVKMDDGEAVAELADHWIVAHGLDGGALKRAVALVDAIKMKMVAAVEALRVESSALDSKRAIYEAALGGAAPLDAAEISKEHRVRKALGLKFKDEAELLVELRRILADASRPRTTRGLAKLTGRSGKTIERVLAANGYAKAPPEHGLLRAERWPS